LTEVDSIVGWVEATKPFDSAVPALRRPSVAAESKGRATPNKTRYLCWVSLSLYPTYKFLSHYFIC